MTGLGINKTKILRKIRAANYLTVAELFLKDNFLLDEPLKFDDVKPRLLGHWGTCPGISLAYNCLKSFDENIEFVVGPGHGFPALQANLFLDGELEKVDQKATLDYAGISYICKNFSWPDGFPSHASPVTPHVICEGGELGYALATSYGYALGHPEKTVAVLIGDGEFETATALASMNLNKLFSGKANGNVLPILHLNGYKISAPTISGRKSERELSELIRGFGFTPLYVRATNQDANVALEYAIDDFKAALNSAYEIFRKIKKGEKQNPPFIIMRTDKGMTGPEELNGVKIRGNFKAHQIPLLNAKNDEKELKVLESWLKSYRFNELFNREKGFTI
jgi:xylulose-5-phosphate/fructose-6-phosphate phosphoketolase